MTFSADPRTLARYLALRADPELGQALRAIEAVLPDLDEPVRASTMALLVAVPASDCFAIARELLGARRRSARVDWHRLVDLAHVLTHAPRSIRRPIARAARRLPASPLPLRLVSNE